MSIFFKRLLSLDHAGFAFCDCMCLPASQIKPAKRAGCRLTEVTHSDLQWDCKYTNFFSDNKLKPKQFNKRC